MTENWAPPVICITGVTLASRDRDTLLYEELRIVQTDTGYSISQGCREKMMDQPSHSAHKHATDSITFINLPTIFPSG